MFCTIYSLAYTNLFFFYSKSIILYSIASVIGNPTSNIRLVIADRFIWKSAYEIVLIGPIELLN